MSQQPPRDPMKDFFKKMKRTALTKTDIADMEKQHQKNTEISFLENEVAKLRQDPRAGQTPRDHPSREQEKPNALEKSNKRIVELVNEVSELRSRLSQLTGEKMSENNSHISDLSDPYRPTKLAEMFRQVYDNEWTCAYEELEKQAIPEDRIIEILAKITKDSDEFCSEVAKQQLERMVTYPLNDVQNPTYECPPGQKYAPRAADNDISDGDRRSAERQMIEFRKSLCHLSVRGLESMFEKFKLEGIRKQYQISGPQRALNDYACALIRISWRMQVQERPMCLVWQAKGQPYNRERFTEYIRKGATVQQTVWPALLLHEKGSLMCRGIVDVK